MPARPVSATDLSIDLALFRQKKSLAEFPLFDGNTLSKAALAKRNTSGAARPSLLLTKSILSVLMGNVSPALVNSESVMVKAASMSGGGAVDAALNWVTNTWTCLYGSTYHLGLVALVEAIANAALAQDFGAAWVDLLDHFNGSRLPLDANLVRDLQEDEKFVEKLIRACDELYYWVRYRAQPCAESHDRIAGVFVTKQWPKEKLTAPVDLSPILLDAGAVRKRVLGLSAGATSTTVPTTSTSSDKGVFKGPQKAILQRAIEDRTATLLFGQTASGKNTCVNQVLAELGWGYESIGGKEGLIDLDFLGSLTKTKKGLAWVDGPLGRAMRRAVDGPIVVFIDEFTRIRPEQVNLLIDLLNEIPEELMVVSGAKLDHKSERGLYRRVEVPQCAEPFICPAENLIVVAACNRGRAYTAYDIDPALMRRFQRKIEFRYLDAESEAALLVEKSTAPLDVKIAKSCVAVATKARQMSETGEVSAPLDPGSLIYWASQLAERLNAESIRWNSSASASIKTSTRTRIITLAQAEAETTWIPAVLAPDLSGVLPLGKITALKDVVRDQFAANLV